MAGTVAKRRATIYRKGTDIVYLFTISNNQLDRGNIDGY